VSAVTVPAESVGEKFKAFKSLVLLEHSVFALPFDVHRRADRDVPVLAQRALAATAADHCWRWSERAPSRWP